MTATRCQLALVCFVACFASGCVYPIGYDPRTWTYVTRMHRGDPDAITRWTLTRTTHDEIYDGLSALRDVSHDGDWDAILRGYKQIHAKILEGWPGYTGRRQWELDEGKEPLSGHLRSEALGGILSYVYDRVGSADRDAFIELRPSPVKHPREHAIWLARGQDAKIVDAAGARLPTKWELFDEHERRLGRR